MAMTSAERQRSYRASRPSAGENGERRLDMWVSTATTLNLSRVAAHRGETRIQVIERLLAEADRRATANMSEATLADYLNSVTR